MTARIVVISDSHGSTDMVDRVISECSPFDLFIHCGDGLKDISSAAIPGNSVVLKVLGNTDIYSGCDAEEILTEIIYGRTVMITHGHQFDVKSGLSRLVHEAENFEAEVILFGHTHKQFLNAGNPLLFNPGNLSKGNYGIIHASQNKEWLFEHRKIKKG